MSTEQNKDVVRRFLEEVWNAGNLDVVDELIAPDYVNHTDPGQPPGPEGVKPLVTQFRSAFPDVHNAIEDVVAEEDRVAVRVTLVGTHTGEWTGRPPTGSAFSVEGMRLYRLTGGKIAEMWSATDSLTMLRQLGVIPAPDLA